MLPLLVLPFLLSPTANFSTAANFSPTVNDTTDLQQVLPAFFKEYCAVGYRPYTPMKLDSFRVDEDRRVLRLYPNESFCSQSFTPEVVNGLRRTLGERTRPTYKGWDIALYDPKGREIAELVPNALRRGRRDKARLWRETDYDGAPWVSFPDRPFKITEGLAGRHLYIWPSHGRVYRDREWQWQRPNLYCTTEDLFTQSIVFPYLFPMLENAGAIVYSPRERDSQPREAVVDNDKPELGGLYEETAAEGNEWRTGEAAGFSQPAGGMNDNARPFLNGTYRKTEATRRRDKHSTAVWRPNIPKAGAYAVYVSYGREGKAVPDARYTVHHKDGRTEVRVNQRMGAGTWVYIGTYDFAAGISDSSRVVLSSESNHRGTVSADAVRFGGGMGNTERGEAGTSGLPRLLEAARYQAAWSGMPDEVVYTTRPANDYTDDLRVRGGMLNILAGGSPYLPDSPGAGVPFCMALAVHSDAGVRRDGSVYGSLSVSTERGANGESVYPGGADRLAAFDLAALILDNLAGDLSHAFHTAWPRREHWDRNYAETRIPNVPSAIIETLSHQNFGDLVYGHDPLFKFTLARSLYATIARYVNFQHGREDCTVQPLPPCRFSAVLVPDGGGAAVRLAWKAEVDTLYGSRPDCYVVYTRRAGGTYDHGRVVKGETLTVPLEKGVHYDFRVTAVNKGGESFPSETLSARYAGLGKPCALLVNAFTRLSGPARIATPDSIGFDIAADIGLPYMTTTAFSGRQINFRADRQGADGAAACGHSGNELAGREIVGNTFDYPALHGETLARVGDYSYCSTGVAAFTSPDFSTRGYALIDYIAGAQARRPYNFRPYPVFPQGAAEKLEHFLKKRHGRLILSGSYLVSDGIKDEAGSRLLKETLKVGLAGQAAPDSLGRLTLTAGDGTPIPLFDRPNEARYCISLPDIIQPAARAATPFAFSTPSDDGKARPAAIVLNEGKLRAALLTVPLECIKEEADRIRILDELLK